MQPKKIGTNEPKEQEQMQDKASEETASAKASKQTKTEEGTKTPVENQANKPPVDPYLQLLQSLKIETPYDMAAYKQGEGALVLFTDPSGKSIFTCGFYLKKELIETLYKAIKK